MIRHNKWAPHQTVLTFRKSRRGIKLDGNRIEGVSGNKEIGLVMDATGLVGKSSQGWGQSQIGPVIVL